MPCVLPVLSIKVLGIINKSGRDNSYIRKSFLFTILGILVSFLILAGFTVALKEAGNIAGWGIQFQNPIFLIFLCVITFAFATNLLGLFEINLPGFLTDKLVNGLEKSEPSHFLGNFLTGMFATILATPCTAPFLSTAISFSLSTSSVNIFIIFFFMGVGLALPYILFFISPALVKFLPKPGAWMNVAKIIFGLLLLATFFWLIYVLAGSGRWFSASSMVITCFILLCFMGFAKRRNLDRGAVFKSVLWGFVVAFGMAYWFSETVEKHSPQDEEIWVNFSEEKIQGYVSDGKVVFLDVTADWCLTCKFNKANVVYPMKDYFKENGIIMMRADYTNIDKNIALYLQKNKAYAIPFNKVYGPKAVDGIKLPALLNRQAIVDAVNHAK